MLGLLLGSLILLTLHLGLQSSHALLQRLDQLSFRLQLTLNLKYE